MAGTNKIISEIQFKYNPEMVEKYGDYKNYLAEQLKTTSTWDLYNKGKAEYATATARYNQAEAIFTQLKKQKHNAEIKYNKLMTALQAEKGEDGVISSSEKSSIASKSGYTTELIKNTHDAEMQVDLALDARFNAVNTQRRGLYFNG